MMILQLFGIFILGLLVGAVLMGAFYYTREPDDLRVQNMGDESDISHQGLKMLQEQAD